MKRWATAALAALAIAVPSFAADVAKGSFHFGPVKFDVVDAIAYEVEVKDASTVVLHLKQPVVFLPWNFSCATGSEGMILPHTYFQQVGADAFARNPLAPSGDRMSRLGPYGSSQG